MIDLQSNDFHIARYKDIVITPVITVIPVFHCKSL